MPTTAVTRKLLSRTRFMGSQKVEGFLRHRRNRPALDTIGADPAPIFTRQTNLGTSDTLNQIDGRANAPVGDGVTKLADDVRWAKSLGQQIQFAAQNAGGFCAAGL